MFETKNFCACGHHVAANVQHTPSCYPSTDTCGRDNKKCEEQNRTKETYYKNFDIKKEDIENLFEPEKDIIYMLNDLEANRYIIFLLFQMCIYINEDAVKYESFYNNYRSLPFKTYDMIQIDEKSAIHKNPESESCCTLI